jgi:pimeloyl-ACP methyl ester carboxylesterase
MLARFQQFISLAVLAMTLAWAVAFTYAGHPVWALLGALAILLGHAAFLGVEFALLASVQRSESAQRASVRELACAWWGEVAAATSVFFWRQPFRSNVEPDNMPAQPGRQRGVVLVHGFFCNRGFWTPWLRQLRARQVPFIAVNLEPVFGSIDHYPSVIEAAVTRLAAATGQVPVVVGHSMGGLAIRAWLSAFDAESRVHRIVTIGSPHHGTWLARWGKTTNGKQMRLDSDWLQRLQAHEPAGRHARFTCFYGRCDNIVFPAMTATLIGADNRHVPAAAHVHMAFRDTVFDEVCAWLDVPAPAASPPRGKGLG